MDEVLFGGSVRGSQTIAIVLSSVIELYYKRGSISFEIRDTL